MTERIYYTDPACQAFTATVTALLEHEGRPAVRLDRSAFYPTSGGQPFDTGTLGPRRVVEVVDEASGVLHVLDAPLEAGTCANGAIDWNRRFDHMQQHTGQHILSAAFDRICSNPTLSFHMGAEVSTIDLARDVSAAELLRAEDDANQVVWSDVPVAIRFVSEGEAARLPLRKESLRGGTLRLIDIDGCDLSACGGTHVRRTGEVGVVTVLGVERVKGGARVTFACGGRALASHRRLRTAVASAIRVLSVAPEDLADAIERVQADARRERKTSKELREALSVHEAHALLEGAQVEAGVRLVVRALDGRDASALKSLAAAMVAEPRVAVALFTTDAPVQVVVARSADLPVDASAVVRTLVERHGGKGGGRPDLAQGGGFVDEPRQLVWTAAGLLEALLGERRP